MQKETIKYIDPTTHKSSITLSALKKMPKDKQKKVMELWFRAHYEDPVHSQPYSSEEGGYIYINGGPFEADEELEGEFGAIVKFSVISELARELEEETTDWTRTNTYMEELYPFDEYEFYSTSKVPPFVSLNNNLLLLNSMASDHEDFSSQDKDMHMMMIYSFAITFFEAYLSETLSKKILSKKEYKIKYLKSEPHLSKQKINLSEIHEEYKNLNTLIKKRLLETNFHNLPLVKTLYKETIDIDIGDISKIIPYIHKRHDFVHRGGKNPKGKNVKTTPSEITSLTKEITSICEIIEESLDSVEENSSIKLVKKATIRL